MKKVYIYEDFSGFNLELYSEELPADKLYDEVCDEYRTLLAVTSDINDLLELCPKYGFTENTPHYQHVVQAFKEILDGRINSSEIE